MTRFAGLQCCDVICCVEATNDGGSSDMLNSATTSFMSTRMLLWVVFIANVIAILIGLSLLERMGEPIIQSRVAETQTEDLNRIYRLLVDTNERVNGVQIELQRGRLATQIDSIENQVHAIQTKIDLSTATR